MGKKEKQPKDGYFAEYGGRFAPETLMAPLLELERAYDKLSGKRRFRKRLSSLLAHYAGRPTPLYSAERLSNHFGGARIYLKREDLLHTGAHKINNAIGQTLLATEMGKRRIIAETGAGQHGVATATAAALFGCECVVYMGTEDMERQRLNVERMRLLGAEVVGVDSGSRTLKDAINEALRDWVTNVRTTHYVLGSVLGPDPYPRMVRDFHRVIGEEARAQLKKQAGRNWPDLAIACVGGGSNAIGLFSAFLEDRRVRLIGVEAGGSGSALGEHAARFDGGSVGVLHGTRTLLLQDDDGQIARTHSVSAGLDYPAVGPEHVAMAEAGLAEYTRASDSEAIEAFHLLAETEGILPALETAHALVEAGKHARVLSEEKIILVNLSGRGDKDVESVLAWDERELVAAASVTVLAAPGTVEAPPEGTPEAAPEKVLEDDPVTVPEDAPDAGAEGETTAVADPATEAVFDVAESEPMEGDEVLDEQVDRAEATGDTSGDDDAVDKDSGDNDSGADDSARPTGEAVGDPEPLDEAGSDEAASDEGASNEGASNEAASDEGASDEAASDEPAHDEAEGDTDG